MNKILDLLAKIAKSNHTHYYIKLAITVVVIFKLLAMIPPFISQLGPGSTAVCLEAGNSPAECSTVTGTSQNELIAACLRAGNPAAECTCLGLDRYSDSSVEEACAELIDSARR
jgi:hypothetical protein